MLKSKKVSVSSKKSAVSSQMAETPRRSKYNNDTPLTSTKTPAISPLGKLKSAVKKGKPLAI